MKHYFINTTNGTAYTGEKAFDVWSFASHDYSDAFRTEHFPTFMMKVSFEEFVAACQEDKNANH